MNDFQKDILITTDKVLFFDMDGTLVDTNLANFLAYKKAINSVVKTDLVLTYNPNIRFNRSVLKNTFPSLTETDFENIIDEKENCYVEFLPETTIIQKNTSILNKYSQTNKTVLVTNCRKDRALTTLKYFGLIEKFNHIFYRVFGEHNKKINKFQNAISAVGVSPNTIIAFENEQAEIDDALEAGIKIINPIIS